MNHAEKARTRLKLTLQQFALLLGVTEGKVILEEQEQGDRRSIPRLLYALILDGPMKVARKLIGERLNETRHDDSESRLLLKLQNTIRESGVV